MIKVLNMQNVFINEKSLWRQKKLQNVRHLLQLIEIYFKKSVDKGALANSFSSLLEKQLLKCTLAFSHF